MSQEEKKSEEKPAGEKLIAGKYKTIEEGEAAIKESERRMHEATEDAAKWRRIAQESLDSSRGSTDTDQETQNFSEEFLARPKEVLDKWGRRITTGVVSLVTEMLDQRDQVSRFISKNPDIEENPRLFMAHVAQTDPEDPSYVARLRKAHKTYKEDLENLKNRGREEEKAAKNFGDKQKDSAAMSSSADGDNAPPRRGKPQISEKDEEGSFNEYMKDREDSRARMLTPQI